MRGQLATSRRAFALITAAAMATLAGSGCRTVRGALSTPEEHAAFKPTRTLPTLEERMRAGEDYLARYPDGTFTAEVRRAYLRADDALWASKQGSVAGMESYLAALPRGPHAKLARRELDAKRLASVDLLGRGARSTEERLAAAAAARVRAREALGTWVRRFADPSIFGAAMVDAPEDLVVAWSLALPQPKCKRLPDGSRRCTKLVTEAYEIPREGERELVFEVRVDESPEGRVCQAVLSGPRLFTRWEEATLLAPLDESIPGVDNQLLVLVQSMVEATIATRPGAPECTVDSVGNAGVWLQFTCGELHLAVSRVGEDSVAISTAYPCSSP